MPLIKRPSKKAFEHNVKVELEAHPGKANRAQNLAIAYSVKRQAAKKKMALGGSADKSPAEKMNEQRGVHKIAPNYDKEHSEAKHGESVARSGNKKEEHKRVLAELRSMPKPQLTAPVKVKGVNEQASEEAPGVSKAGKLQRFASTRKRSEETIAPIRKEHTRILSEMRSMPKPKLAEGGMIDKKAATEAQRGPKMAASSIIKAHPIDALGRRLDALEAHLESTMPPAPITEEPDHADDEEGADRQGPSTPSLKMKKMANGGMADPDHDDNIHNEAIDHEFGDGAEEDELEHPAGLTEDDDEIGDKDAMSSHMKMLAKGGEISPEDEEHEDMSASIASAIMAKLKHAAELESGSEDEDKAERFADGGEVMGKSDSLFDHLKNNKEEPNFFPPRNGEVLKENHDEGMDDVHEPEDSNEHADMREEDSENEDDRSIVGSIRRKMKMKSPIAK